MKNIIVIFFLSLSLLIVSFKDGSFSGLPIGASIPKAEVGMKDVSGKTVSL